jgi:hypothetical protein
MLVPVIATLLAAGACTGGSTDDPDATQDDFRRHHSSVDAGSSSDTGTPDSGTSDTGVHDTGLPDTGRADAGLPETGLADTGLADTGTVADTGTPDAKPEDGGKPDSGGGGDIIPADRKIAWDPGVPGGIPLRQKAPYATLAAGSTASVIQTALNGAGALATSEATSQVVFLSAGTYNITGTLYLPSYVTLRGAGQGQTILNLTGSPSGAYGSAISIGFNGAWPATSAGGSFTPIVGDTQLGDVHAGATTITVGSTSGISVGSYLVINELNDTFVTDWGEYSWVNGQIVNTPGPECPWCGNGWDGSQDRLLGQIVEVTGVSGNTVTFNPPLYITYKSALSPQAYPFTMGAKYAGVESLTVRANKTGYDENFLMHQAAYCWIKDVESDFADGDHVQLWWTFRSEVRDSFIHDGFSHGPGVYDDALKLKYKASANLIENNIFWRMHTSIMVNDGAAGNVIGYNYSTGDYHDQSLTWEIMDFDFHEAHPMFTLFEGNVATQFNPDSLHGSSSHSTLLRNWFSGIDFYAPPENARGPIDNASGFWEDSNSIAIKLDYTTHYNNLIGNIVGSPRQVSKGGVYESIAPASLPNPVCYAFGYDGSHVPHDDSPYKTVLMHGNWDFVTKVQSWDSAIANQSIPESYYRTSKPSFFGTLPWPPIDPANPATATATAIPAGYRFVNGSKPPGAP